MNDIGIAQIKLTEKEIDAAVAVLRSGALRQGPQCAAFEEEFAAKAGARQAVTCANGSASLHLAYLTFLEPGDEVLVPAFTFIATGSMVSVAGGRPVFCDVDPETFLIDLADAERRITPRTKAISPVHLFGNPCDIQAVRDFAERHKLTIVWDAAQAHGAKMNGRDLGAEGAFTSYSFYPSKNMFVGEGGIVTTDSDERAEKLRLFRSHGESGRYLHTALGLNYRMTDLEAAIGREQLKRLDSMVETRSANAVVLNEGLADVPGIRAQRVTPGADHAWHQYCVVVDPAEFGCDRDALAERLREQGVASGVHYPRGLHQQPIFEEMYGATSLPQTESLAERILALPVHHGMGTAEAARVVEAVHAAGG